MAPRRSRQLDLPAPRTWGGRRPGAGRKPTRDRPGPRHTRRPPHDVRHPVHVTIRVRRGIPSLRSGAIFPALRQALAASSREGFRLLHFSVQSDHLHLIVEADAAPTLSRGVQGLAVRCARAINRSLDRRGPVWNERYHPHALGTPREVRVGLAYVLLELPQAPAGGPGHRSVQLGALVRRLGPAIAPAPDHPSPVRPPRTWLAASGWRRAGGAIDVREAPAASQVGLL